MPTVVLQNYDEDFAWKNEHIIHQLKQIICRLIVLNLYILQKNLLHKTVYWYRVKKELYIKCT